MQNISTFVLLAVDKAISIKMWMKEINAQETNRHFAHMMSYDTVTPKLPLHKWICNWVHIAENIDFIVIESLSRWMVQYSNSFNSNEGYSFSLSLHRLPLYFALKAAYEFKIMNHIKMYLQMSHAAVSSNRKFYQFNGLIHWAEKRNYIQNA